MSEKRWTVVVSGSAYQIMDNGQPAILLEDTTGDTDVVVEWIVERLNRLDELERANEKQEQS